MDVCLVTGGAGFIGSHLVKALVAGKREVRVLDNLSTGSLANLGRCVREIEVIVGDLRDLDLVREVVKGVDVVFHLASVSPDESSFGLLGFPCQTDVETAHVLIASRDLAVKRLVYASSTQVYGARHATPRAETDSVAPESSLAIAKLSGEQSCTAFTLLCGLETVRLRYSNVFGPRQSPSSPHARIVPDALTAMLAAQNPGVEGTGDERQDLIFIEDAVQATVLAAEVAGISGRVYNIAQGQTTTALEVVGMLNETLGTRFFGVPTGLPFEEDLGTPVDISRAREELQFSPTKDLRQSLAKCVRSYSGGLFSGPRHGLQRFTEA